MGGQKAFNIYLYLSHVDVVQMTDNIEQFIQKGLNIFIYIW